MIPLGKRMVMITCIASENEFILRGYQDPRFDF
jgi:hypothetical protein